MLQICGQLYSNFLNFNLFQHLFSMDHIDKCALETKVSLDICIFYIKES